MGTYGFYVLSAEKLIKMIAISICLLQVNKNNLFLKVVEPMLLEILCPIFNNPVYKFIQLIYVTTSANCKFLYEIKWKIGSRHLDTAYLQLHCDAFSG